ncbi:MAG TPA: UbiA prenyltransferase family protein [Candidatus Humimicrobiaceae bacterium]|nr:UbiA prenyltransferase family protein [Candidatus Humimicrobiaceae bacterium]
MKDWRAYFGLGILGFILARGFLFPLLDILLFSIIGVLLLAFGFSVNNFFDIKEDGEKREVKSLLVQNKKNFFLSVSPGILALFLSGYFGTEIFLFVLIAGLIGFFYSAPPLRMKSRPFLDLISHGLFAGALIFIFPFLIFSPELTLPHYLIAFSIFYLSTMLETRNHLEDYQSDSRAGLQTTVCFLGYKKSENLLKYLAFFYPLVLFPVFFFFFSKFLLPFLILTIFFLLLLMFKKNYRIFDAYAVFSYIVISLATIYS